ncbi:MAG: hypothetical protein AAFY60_03495, partial [Myxococcota bacterium]
SPVVDAGAYEVQVARNLTFASTSSEARVRKRQHTTPVLPLGLYFVRVRAVGDAGSGPWSAAKAIAPRAGEPDQGDEPVVLASRSVEPLAPEPAAPRAKKPLALRIFGLPDRTFSQAPSITIRGRSVAGARVSAGGVAVQASPEFALTVKLVHGRNDLVLEATRADERVERTRVVYYADPRKVQKDLAKLRVLRQQLDDLRAIQNEVRATSRELKGALKGAPAAEAKAIETELDEVERASAELEREIGRAFDSVQSLLTP